MNILKILVALAALPAMARPILREGPIQLRVLEIHDPAWQHELFPIQKTLRLRDLELADQRRILKLLQNEFDKDRLGSLKTSSVIPLGQALRLDETGAMAKFILLSQDSVPRAKFRAVKRQVLLATSQDSSLVSSVHSAFHWRLGEKEPGYTLEDRQAADIRHLQPEVWAQIESDPKAEARLLFEMADDHQEAVDFKGADAHTLLRTILFRKPIETCPPLLMPD